MHNHRNTFIAIHSLLGYASNTSTMIVSVSNSYLDREILAFLQIGPCQIMNIEVMMVWKELTKFDPLDDDADTLLTQ